MMTDALIVHCFVRGLAGGSTDNWASLIFELIDVGLTSSIGLAFLFDAIIDTGLIKDTNPLTFVAYGLGVLVIFYEWFRTLTGKFPNGSEILYMGIIAVGCGSWVLIQFFLIIWHENWKGFKYLFLAALSGGIGFFPLIDSKAQNYLCESFGCHWNAQTLWFIMTDVAIYFIYRYYNTRASYSKIQNISQIQLLNNNKTPASLYLEMNKPEQQFQQPSYFIYNPNSYGLYQGN